MNGLDRYYNIFDLRKAAKRRLPKGVFEAMFAAEPAPQAIADTQYQNMHMLRPTTHWQPDIAALRSAATRVVEAAEGPSTYRQS